MTANPASNTIRWHFVKMSPYDCLFLRSRRLTVENPHDPLGRHDVLAKVPLAKGTGSVEISDSLDGVYHKLPSDRTLRTIDFEITDKGNIADLRGGGPVRFEICLTR